MKYVALESPRRLRLVMTLLAIALAIMLIGWGATRWGVRHARAQADETAEEMARSHAGLLASELQKFRLLPLVLSEYPDVGAILEGGGAATAMRLNGKLELLAGRTDAAAIYVIGLDGRTLAASNWRLPTSFVDQNFDFRPYFKEALVDGGAELYALGTISRRPGLFIARRISERGRPLGVIVVKVEFDRLEARWADQPGITFITDSHGVVIITSHPPWRFRATSPLDAPTRAFIRRSIQFGELPLDPLGTRTNEGGDLFLQGQTEAYRIASLPAGLEGAALSYLQPLGPAQASASASARAAVLAIIVVVVVATAWIWRSRIRQAAQREAQRALEGEVASRTAELRETNRRLGEESEQRRVADHRFRAAREELAQANRLGSIGQITAGVAHEINQPVAAIRTFTENACQLLDRKEPDKVRTNLSHVLDLTERIGRITTELRTFARRGTPVVGSVSLRAVLDGSLLLIGDGIRAAGVQFELSGFSRDVMVVADKVRLEQVLINLIQNALDALKDTPQPKIAVMVRMGKTVAIDVADNGPGIAPDIANDLFTPFVTGKRDGLGLGLGIARDIAREFGGALESIASPLGGAGFRVTLRRA